MNGVDLDEVQRFVDEVAPLHPELLGAKVEEVHTLMRAAAVARAVIKASHEFYDGDVYFGLDINPYTLRFEMKYLLWVTPDRGIVLHPGPERLVEDMDVNK